MLPGRDRLGNQAGFDRDPDPEPGQQVSQVAPAKKVQKDEAGGDELDEPLVRFDLLRGGVSLALRKPTRSRDHFVRISPVRCRPEGLVRSTGIFGRSPVASIRMRADEDDTKPCLQTELITTYGRAGYDRKMDCTNGPNLSLSKEWRDWAYR